MDGRPHSRAYPQIQSHTTIQNKRDKRKMNELVLSQQGQSGVLAGHAAVKHGTQNNLFCSFDSSLRKTLSKQLNKYCR